MPTTLLFLTSNTNPSKRKCHLSSHLFWSMLEIFTNVRPSLLFKCKFSPMKMALCSHRIYSPLIHFLPLTFDQWVGRQCTYVIRCNIRLLACSLARSLTRSFTRTHSPIMQYHNSKNLTTHESSTIDESMTMCACVQEWANATSRPLRRSIHARIHTHTHTHIDQHRALPYVKRPAASWFSLLSSVLDNAIFETILNSFSCDLDLVLDHSLLVVAPNFSHVTWHLP